MFINNLCLNGKRLSALLLLIILLTSACATAPQPEAESRIEKSLSTKDETEPMPEAMAEPSVAASDHGDEYAAEMAEEKAPSPEMPAGKEHSFAGKGRTPKASGLRAGYADDNRQFNYFINFLEKYAAQAPHYNINIDERIVLRIKDAEGKTVANARVKIYSGTSLLTEGLTYSDGSFLFFPSEYDNRISAFRAEVSHDHSHKELTLDRQGKRDVEIKLDSRRRAAQQIPLDILFVLDTTGSMGEEIQRLKTTIEMINLNLTSLSSQPKVRFGMVLYKDRVDEYITKTIPLTESLDKFQASLNKVKASGGGDHPEDLQSALMDSMKKIDWNNDGIRLAFIITDAPPHIDYGQQYTYVDAAQEARQKGIKMFSVGTGGLNIMGEYILRQISQYTYGRYIFLTYGESGESEGGAPGSVSHHTGSNFETDKLEAIIIRFAKEELRNITGNAMEETEEYFEAKQIKDEEKGETLKKLFDMAVSQLIDYSAISISPDTPVALFPFAMKDKNLASNAEYLGEQLLFSLSRNNSFKVLERKDIQAVLDETKFQLSGFVPEEEAVEAGKLAGARIIITGNIYEGAKNYELFLKLLRVKTGEVLSVTKLVVSKKLSLG